MHHVRREAKDDGRPLKAWQEGKPVCPPPHIVACPGLAHAERSAAGPVHVALCTHMFTHTCGPPQIANYWEPAKKLLNDPSKFLESLLSYDKDNISDSIIKKVEPYIQVCVRSRVLEAYRVGIHVARHALCSHAV